MLRGQAVISMRQSPEGQKDKHRAGDQPDKRTPERAIKVWGWSRHGWGDVRVSRCAAKIRAWAKGPNTQEGLRFLRHRMYSSRFWRVRYLMPRKDTV